MRCPIVGKGERGAVELQVGELVESGGHDWDV